MSTITLPNVYVPGQTLSATSLNQNFQTIYNDYNGNITNANISSSAAIVLSKLALNPGSLAFNKQTTGNYTWASGLTTDSQPRVSQTSDMGLRFGPGGSTAPDVELIRSASETLQLADSSGGAAVLDMNNGSIINVGGISGTGAAPVNGGRVYMTTGSPYADHNAASTIYFGPAVSNVININGTVQTFAEASLSISALSTGVYDVYVNSASSTTVAVTTAAWGGLNTPPTRGTDVYGRPTKNAAAGFLLVGAIWVNGSNQTIDNTSSRDVANLYNQVPKSLFAQIGTANWTYSGGWRASNANTTDGAGRFSAVSVLGTYPINATFHSATGSSGATTPGQNAIGINSTSSPLNSVMQGTGTANHEAITITAYTPLTQGFNFIQMLEQSLAGINTAFFVGNTADGTTGCVSWMTGLGWF